MLHTHITFRDTPRITTFEAALPLADHCLEFPAGTLLAMLLGAQGEVNDVLVFDNGDHCPVEIVELVSSHAHADDHALLIAMNRRSCDPSDSDDLATWQAMSAAAREGGLVLRDWFILVDDLLWVPSEVSDSGAGW